MGIIPFITIIFTSCHGYSYTQPFQDEIHKDRILF